MRMGLMSLALGSMFAVAATANAGIVMSVTNLGVPTRLNSTGGTVDSLPGYTAFKLTASSNTADSINAIDFWSSALTTAGTNNHPAFGYTNAVQRWSSSGADGIYDTKTVQSAFLNNSTNVASLDSHYLPPATQTPGNPDETNNAVSGVTTITGHASTDSTGWGIGGGIFGTAVTLGSSVDVAYIIVKDGELAHYEGQVSTTAAGAFFNVSGDVGTAIPEPASLSLLALGGLALLRRRH